MPQTTARIAATLTAILLSASLALAQQTPAPEPESASAPKFDQSNWAKASAGASSKHKLIIATSADPTRRHACHVKSFTPDQLVCKGSFGKTHIYKPQEIAALILPGDIDVEIRFLLGFNSALGAAIWGTVVLAPVCIPCAVGTGIAALVFFNAAGATAFAGSQSEVLLYLTPGQTLQVKLH